MSGSRSPTLRGPSVLSRVMAKPKFTPGPYHVSGSGPKMRSIKSAGGRTVAYVLFAERRESECEATARLFAAAPDLLAEVQCFVTNCPCGNHSEEVGRTNTSHSNSACDFCASGVTLMGKVEGR